MTEGDPWEQILAAMRGRHDLTPPWICQVCTRLVPVTGAAIVETIEVNRRHLVCATDDVAAQLETLQFSLGEGPGVYAVRTGTPVQVSDLHQAGHLQWPIFAEAASHTTARALYCIPLRIETISVGVLTLYRDQPGLLTDPELTSAQLCAHVAFWMLLASRVDPRADPPPPQPTDPNHTPAAIQQATRMVMTQLAISADAALATLRAYAYAHAQPLDQVAGHIISGRLRFPLDNQ